MKKEYLPDAIIVGIVALTAFLLAERPPFAGQLSVGEWATQTASVGKTVLRDKREAVGKDLPGFFIEDKAAEALKKRNIFTLDGSYEAVKLPRGMTAIPENPYNLLAILQGKEKKALFADFTGAVITASLNKKMIDGYTVTRIGDLSVTLKRGNEAKELSVFKMIRTGTAVGATAKRKDKAQAALPLYTLIGVTQGKGGATALLRDDTGTVYAAVKGEKLMDGYVLSRVDSVSVELRRGREVKELRLFDSSSPPEPPAAEKPRQAPGAARAK